MQYGIIVPMHTEKLLACAAAEGALINHVIGLLMQSTQHLILLAPALTKPSWVI
jgi:hypothetical protein